MGRAVGKERRSKSRDRGEGGGKRREKVERVEGRVMAWGWLGEGGCGGKAEC